MNRDTPESLLQFMNDATQSVRAALERPLEDKKIDHSKFLQKQMFDNQSVVKEQRRYKCHTRRRRSKFPQQPKNSHPDKWENGFAAQPQILSEILGIPDPTQHGVFQDQHLTQWEQNLHRSPNMCREYNDDSVGGMLEWQGQFNMNPQQGSVPRPAASSYTDSQAHFQTEGHRREMYTQMTGTQFTYTHRNAPRTLDEVVNRMPVGCHLPPPVPHSVSNFTANRCQKQMDVASKRRMPLVLGIPENEGRYSPPPILAREVPSHPQVQNVEYSPNDIDLLSQLVTELDKTQCLDNLTGDSAFQPSPKENYIEDMRALGRRCVGISGEHGERIDPSGLIYADQKRCNGSNREQFANQSSKQKRFATKQSSFDLACALQETHLNSFDNPGLHDVRFGLNGLKRSSASMEALQINTGLSQENSNRIHVQRNDVSFPKLRKSNVLMAMHERRSMPNLYTNTPRQKAAHANAKVPNERVRSVQAWDGTYPAGSLEDFLSHSFDNGLGSVDFNGSVVPKRHPKLVDINWASFDSDCSQPLQSELNTMYDSDAVAVAKSTEATSDEEEVEEEHHSDVLQRCDASSSAATMPLPSFSSVFLDK